MIPPLNLYYPILSSSLIFHRFFCPTSQHTYLQPDLHYCWWKKSDTTCDVWNPMKKTLIFWYSLCQTGDLTGFLNYPTVPISTNLGEPSQEDVLQRAMSRVGDEGYNLVWNNCEHFAVRPWGGLGQRWSDGGSSGNKNWASRLWFFSPESTVTECS